MSIQMRGFYRSRGGRATIAALAMAAAGYFAGAVVQSLRAPNNEPAAFAERAQAAGINLRDAGQAAGAPFAIAPSADASRRVDAEWLGTPRECNLEKSISTACIFMD